MATLSPSLAISICGCRNCGALKPSKLTLATQSKKGSLGFPKTNDPGRSLLRSQVASNGAHRRKPILAVEAKSRPSSQEVVAPGIEVEDPSTVSTYHFRTQFGGSVKVSVGKKKNSNYVVYIEVSSLELEIRDCRLVMVWGIYRSNSSSFLPVNSLDPDSPSRDDGTMDNSFLQISPGKFIVQLAFEARQPPFYLSFLLKPMRSGVDVSGGLEIRSHRKTNFCVPVGFHPGSPTTLGLSYSADGSMNFALVSRTAQSVVLCLYDDDSKVDKPALEIDLDSYVNRTGDVWHASIEGGRTFQIYGFRCIPKGIDRSKVDRVLLDPYAKVIVNPLMKGKTSLLQNKYLGRLCKEPDFDWTGDVHPNLPMEKLVVYRLNVARFTQNQSSQLYSDVLGTFAGVIEKVKHLKDLGVTAVLMEPIFPYDKQQGSYSPLHFFSPSNLYGHSGGSTFAINSMKEMVKTLHANGIEVFMEVNFTHTAEYGAIQGIDDSSYYHHGKKVNGSGSNSALNCNYPVVTSLILDCLRYWVSQFHVDGFCFLNASSLLRGFHGESLSRPPLIEAIAFDPLLSKTKIVADFWDPREMLSKETLCFPHWKRWAEINTKFCHDVRSFLKGEGPLSSLATRLCGSGDIFSNGRGPAFSFNYVARNSGLSLVDLVSYSSDELLAAEVSWNCGEEGPTSKTMILERRLKQIKNYLFILFVSLGVPVLNMGDECGQSSGGSTSYLHRKPLDWSLLSTGFGIQTTQFISFLSALRGRRSDIFQKWNFLDVENIEWYGNDQSPPKWDDPSSKFLAMALKADRSKSMIDPESGYLKKGDIFMAFNAGRKMVSVLLPSAPEGMEWRRLVDTGLPYPVFFSGNGEPVDEQMQGLVVYEMKSHSCVLFEASSCDD
ncbi:unnamed protein product [Linum tenue]|uniref:Glycosyl hydrolase family 13 catalytic domain-containing protein n=1 Tax=Linum tenue TaxID=586396 RepID=A0AAV0ID13_9ROSI|nr:unnamed protein product [Linum tenue]